MGKHISLLVRWHDTKREVLMMWTVLTWVVLGLLAGAIVTLLTYHSHRSNAVANISLGILGAVIGGLVLRFFGVQLVGEFTIASFITALLGATVLLALASALQRDRI